MNHPKHEEWIPLIYGEADAAAKRHLEAHLSSCAECRTHVEAWRRTMGRLDAWKLPQSPRVAKGFSWRPLAWAAAAALVIGAFVAGRFSAPSVDAQQWRTELKSELLAELQQGLGRMAADSSNALAGLEARVVAMSDRDGKLFANELVRVVNSLRTEDRSETEALFERLQKQYTTDFVLLRRDLETLASTTDEEIENARAKLSALASSQNPQN